MILLYAVNYINMHEHESFSHGNEWRKLWFKEHRRYDYHNKTEFDYFESQATNHQVRTSSWSKTTKAWNSLIYDHYRWHVVGNPPDEKLVKKYFPNN